MWAVVCALALAGVGAGDVFTRDEGATGRREVRQGCVSDGRVYGEGAAVRARDPCLRCACAGGALHCRRRACAPLPPPPPPCHLLHPRGDCCPHVHCPDGVRFALPDITSDIDFQPTPKYEGLGLPACVEGGSVYAAGSAMSSTRACEQCFCLAGARRCVRPRCLPAPPACRAAPAPGACCPHRYYCHHPTTPAPADRNAHDCQTSEGEWVDEGAQVVSKEGPCEQCFCLRGAIQCQQQRCAPRLHGCQPLVLPGHCCPHQYRCNHTKHDNTHSLFEHPHNYLDSVKNEDRSFHSSRSTAKRETTIKMLSTAMEKTLATSTSDDLMNSLNGDKITTLNNIETETESTQPIEDSTKDATTIATEPSTTEESSTTEQPESSIKIMINGTINCTSELSSTSLLYNITSINDTLKMHMETQPRVPFIDRMDVESHTFPANELITERPQEELDDNESFVINVTSSLRTNTTFSSPSLTTTTVLPKSTPLTSETHNISKKTKEDADYDYNEPTLPPSLPNLKIIPFVAADAVVEDEASAKESAYPILEREDKFPVYYPSSDAKDNFPTRREDVYSPSQYPLYSNKAEYPINHHLSEIYTSNLEDIEKPIELTVGTSFENKNVIVPESRESLSNDMKLESPAVNLFSPPAETEGGFIPKAPGIIEDYYQVFSSTPRPSLPHLTTSMHLDDTGECTTIDGSRVEAGKSVRQACSVCTCVWGELHCSPRPCAAPPPCRRQPAPPPLCCGPLLCDNDNVTKIQHVIEAQNNTQDTHPGPVNNKNDTFINPVEISITTSSSVDDDETSEESELKELNRTVSSLEVTTTRPLTTTSTERVEADIAPVVQSNATDTQSQEYEDEDDDSGFSLGSVLQLLLSENYETTTTVPFKKMPPSQMNTTKRPSSPTTTTTTTTTTTKRPSASHFVPSNQYSFVPSKKLSSVDRIDHLVLGEATAIRRSTPRPTARPVVTTRKTFTKPTPRPLTTKNVEITSKGQNTVQVSRAPNVIPGLLPGLPKVAGCNIYGRMYHLGGRIAELSSPCQECTCTELGVNCAPLSC